VISEKNDRWVVQMKRCKSQHKSETWSTNGEWTPRRVKKFFEVCEMVNRQETGRKIGVHPIGFLIRARFFNFSFEQRPKCIWRDIGWPNRTTSVSWGRRMRDWAKVICCSRFYLLVVNFGALTYVVHWMIFQQLLQKFLRIPSQWLHIDHNFSSFSSFCFVVC
jgi:hypothetical protein